MGRAPCCDKANVKKGPWCPEEDAKLKAFIEQYGTGDNWIALPQKIGLNRCGKSCRLRWLNYLRPNLKHGGFSEEEDNLICTLFISIGSRWSIIAAQLPGRTDNDIKNYWNTRLKKKLLGRRKQQSDMDPRGGSASLSSSALERLQLHMQLHNPFSPYNNPSLWPKLHPLNATNFPSMEHSLPIGFSDTMPRIDDQMVSLPMCATPMLVPKPEESNGILVDDRPGGSFVEHDNYVNEFDCLSTMWWTNEMDSKSTSSNSMDSNGMFQDYVLGYNM